MKKLKIESPSGYEIDKEKSTFEKIVFKKVKKELPATLEEVVEDLGENDKDVKDFRILENCGVSEHILDYQICVLICKSLNKGWVPDWNDISTYKYFPWLHMKDGSCVSYNCWSTCSGASARLCLKNADLAKYAGTTFNQYFKKYMLYN